MPWESDPIIRYLASRYGDMHLYPVDPHKRACIDRWIDSQPAELNRSWSHAFLALVRKSPIHQDHEANKLSSTN